MAAGFPAGAEGDGVAEVDVTADGVGVVEELVDVVVGETEVPGDDAEEPVGAVSVTMTVVQVGAGV